MARVYVKPHKREGQRVKGFWRKIDGSLTLKSPAQQKSEQLVVHGNTVQEISTATQIRANARIVAKPAMSRDQLPVHEEAWTQLAEVPPETLAKTLGRKQLDQLTRSAPEEAWRRHFNNALLMNVQGETAARIVPNTVRELDPTVGGSERQAKAEDVPVGTTGTLEGHGDDYEVVGYWRGYLRLRHRGTETEVKAPTDAFFPSGVELPPEKELFVSSIIRRGDGASVKIVRVEGGGLKAKYRVYVNGKLAGEGSYAAATNFTKPVKPKPVGMEGTATVAATNPRAHWESLAAQKRAIIASPTTTPQQKTDSRRSLAQIQEWLDAHAGLQDAELSGDRTRITRAEKRWKNAKAALRR